MRVPFAPLVFLIATMWAVSNGAYARTNSDPIVDCDKLRVDPVTCTACNIYHEARGQVDPGMLAVGLVTRNRVVSPLYKGDFCAVVWEKHKWRVGPKKNCWKEKRCGWSPQFSWTKDGRPDHVYNMDAWVKSLTYAAYVVNAHTEGTPIHDITMGALWYHRAELQEPVKVVRDEEHALRWHIWQTTQHAPYWMDDYFPTVKIGDHTFYAKDEESAIKAMMSFMPNFDVVQAEEEPADAEASVDVETADGNFTVNTVPVDAK